MEIVWVRKQHDTMDEECAIRTYTLFMLDLLVLYMYVWVLVLDL